MAKTPSKKSGAGGAGARANFKLWRARKKDEKSRRVKLHKSFKRSYREDYVRELEVPGLMHHAMATFKLLFRNWKIFLPFILLIVLLNILFVGLMSEDTYLQFQDTLDETDQAIMNGQAGNFLKAGLLLIATITTGGLTRGMSEVQQLIAVILFIIIWLVTIYLLRHILAGHKPKLRDGLYNALAPLLSSFCIVVVMFLEAIPLMIVIITYSAAVQTQFLETPFYALVYFIFAALLTLLSLYLISSSLLALIAVSAPGLYPMAALHTASDLIAGRRIRWLIRLLYLFFVVAICWVIVVLPNILVDMWLKSSFDWLSGFPWVSFVLLFMTVFSLIYTTAYVYLFYRRMLDYDDD